MNRSTTMIRRRANVSYAGPVLNRRYASVRCKSRNPITGQDEVGYRTDSIWDNLSTQACSGPRSGTSQCYTEHLYNICTMLDHRQDVGPTLYKYFLFTGITQCHRRMLANLFHFDFIAFLLNSYFV